MKHLDRLVFAACSGVVATLSPSGVSSSPALLEVPIECRAESNNDGCEMTLSCPAGSSIHSALAACNLEYGPINDTQLSWVAAGYIQVIAPSDYVEEGSCWIGDNRLNSGKLQLAGLDQLSRISVGCQEHDKNGGDCHIRGVLYCQ